MPARRWPKRPVLAPDVRRTARRALALLCIAALVAWTWSMGAMLRGMIADYAVSTAKDQVVSLVNEIVKEVMGQEQFQGERLVELERDSAGNITAVSANVTAVNSLAAEVLSRTVQRTQENTFTVRIPLANLLGSALLMNRGPAISVQVTMLSSSTAGFRSEMTAAGINQTRHQLFLELNVQLSFLLPWRDMDASVQTEVLVSETVIVGQVPGTYMSLER